MPYTCVYRAVMGVLAAVASRGCSRSGRARAAGHQGATPGRPGERAAAASGLAPCAHASSGRSAAFVSAAAWLTCVCQPRAATKGAKTTCLKFHRPMRFCRGFSLSLQEALENVRARVSAGRCCTLNSHLLSSRLSFVLAETLAFRLLECLRAASDTSVGRHKGDVHASPFEPRPGNNPLEAAPAIQPHSAPY